MGIKVRGDSKSERQDRCTEVLDMEQKHHILVDRILMKFPVKSQR